MKKSKPFFLFILSLIILIITTIIFFPKVHPFYSLKEVVTKDSIKITASNIISDFQLDLEERTVGLELSSNNKLLRRAQEEFGLRKANEIIIEGYPAFKWRYRQNSVEDETSNSDEEQVIANLLGNIRFDFDQAGYLSSLRIDVDDDTELPLLDEKDAKTLVLHFIKKYTRYKDIAIDTSSSSKNQSDNSISITLSPTEGAEIDNSTVIRRANRTDYKFNFKAYDEFTGDEVLLTINLAGNVISRFDAEHQIKDKVKDKPIYSVIVQIACSVILFVIVIIVAYKKFRAYEIGFKSALIIGGISSLGLLVEMIFETGANFQTEMIIGLILGPLFLGGGLVIVWAVNEAAGREVWKNKYVEFDLISNGHFLHSRIGNMILYGLGVGMLLLSLWMILVFVFDLLMPIAIVREGGDDTLFTGSNDALYLLGKFTYRSVYKAALLVGLTTSLLRKIISSKWLLILASALVYSICLQGSILPFGIDLLVELIIGMVLIYMFIQFNLFTVLISVFTYAILSSGIMYFFVESPDFTESLWLLITIAAIPVIIAIISLFTKDKLNDIESITPAFAKNVTERQRLQGEIEAAKVIQSSFLPNTTPKVEGLDIAAKCLPALEVGGDYYDFIKHDDKNLSVLIGDVAGKGTKAAFVMSLTKGFFKALARKMVNPSKVLSEMNELFYEDVGRGSFISIIYGQFDLQNKKFVYGRAGHNPVLYYKESTNKSIYLQPQGIAIGMEKGILFSKTIEEEVIEFEKGDIFVLYTDGFPEAMNTKDQQFGEEEFAKIVEANSNKSAHDLMEVFFKDTLKFIGRAKQYDDMTIVVIKVR
jgi:sigma-B regulation protein RsbU (phosphoserine phosphatase)